MKLLTISSRLITLTQSEPSGPTVLDLLIQGSQTRAEGAAL